METMVFLVLALLLTGFLTALSVLGMATLHATVRVILPARRPEAPVRVS
ncbi:MULTISPECIES: hypothetical protein [Azospirillum]|uniref:Uncharacterized protein n=1 Tax=Azospirillum brasilense TaxID=192 RepID=A0ABU4PEQ9_AZOBR|nr:MULTISPECIES: hypothetical protein [Azospirillum]MDW7553315.1 hypothetical protein [Azospirillum brasilense]MDW7593306.1 hypothetical protein [Azospirillum brasilense]MDW7628634.1 hypothetical protein [Azospirillum brasilense]MDX5955271.1 hypothetical protein [Azospirillum brasilense]TVZ54592.1 hypothetical protein OH82_03649 [Azospirillum brasilense]